MAGLHEFPRIINRVCHSPSERLTRLVLSSRGCRETYDSKQINKMIFYFTACRTESFAFI